MTTIGIDLGGTKTMAVLVKAGVVVERYKRATPRTGGPSAVIETLVRVAEAVDPHGEAAAVGLGVPGPVIPGTGILPAAPNLPDWDSDLPLTSVLSERLGRPVAIDNDVNVATLAEHRFGAGKGVDNLLGVFAGTGVGAGLILDGKLRQGPRGLAGEIGHTFVSFEDFDHAVVGRGELEDYAGRNSLEARVKSSDPDEAAFLLGLRKNGRLKSKAWADGIEAGDPLARRLVDTAASAIATSIASAIALIDIEVVVLGGGFAERLGEVFRARVEREVLARSFAATSAPVRSARLGSIGGALGAAQLAEGPR